VRRGEMTLFDRGAQRLDGFTNEWPDIKQRLV